MIKQGKENTQLVPVCWLKQNMNRSRKLMHVYLILRAESASYAGYVENHIEFLMDRGFAKSTAYRLVKRMIDIGWITSTPKGVKIVSVHKLKPTSNRYAARIYNEWLSDYSTFEAAMFTVLVNNVFNTNFVRQEREKNDNGNDKQSVEGSTYKSYSGEAGITTERVMAQQLDINQATFNRLKRRAAKLGMINFRSEPNWEMGFESKESALQYISSMGRNQQLIQKGARVFLVLGTVINITTPLITKYAQMVQV